jgi:hypothetical protein
VTFPAQSGTRYAWRCDVCGTRIADGTGYVTIDYDRVLRPAREKIRWEALHRDCDPHPERSDYWIAVERIRAEDQLTWWTLHLGDKRWIGRTDWINFTNSHVRAVR